MQHGVKKNLCHYLMALNMWNIIDFSAISTSGELEAIHWYATGSSGGPSGMHTLARSERADVAAPISFICDPLWHCVSQPPVCSWYRKAVTNAGAKLEVRTLLTLLWLAQRNGRAQETGGALYFEGRGHLAGLWTLKAPVRVNPVTWCHDEALSLAHIHTEKASAANRSA